MPQQSQFVSVDGLVPKDHIYRKFLALINFSTLSKKLTKDLSDRELEKFLQENIPAKLFCGFDFTDPTPHFTLFSKIRTKIGTSRLSEMFRKVREELKEKGYINEIFNFVDSTHLISKSKLWEERDKAIQQNYEKLNNESLPKVAVDKQARIGCKGQKKFWYGYKEIVSVDMQSGLLNKVTIRPGNETDAKILKHVCPKQGAVYGDKGFCDGEAVKTIHRNGCHDGTIKKKNMKEKNKEKDRWLSGIRSPYERVFSQKKKASEISWNCEKSIFCLYGVFDFQLEKICCFRSTSNYYLT